MRWTIVSFVLLAVSAPAVLAQSGVATVDPGMTKAQVVEALGRPAAERSAGEYTYLFYQNGCERECGMTDLVTLERDTVIDAIFRASWRRYTGVSSSPVPRRPVQAVAGSGARQPLRVGGGPPAAAARAPRAVDIAALFDDSTAVRADLAAARTPRGVDISGLFDDSAAVRAELAAAAPTPAPPPAQPRRAPEGSGVDLSSLFDEPVRTQPAPSRAVQTLVDPDTIKVSPRVNTAEEPRREGATWSTWPPPRATETPARSPARADSTPAPAPAGGATRSVWPPPRDKPATDSATTTQPPKVEKKSEPRSSGRPVWPPPRETPPE